MVKAYSKLSKEDKEKFRDACLSLFRDTFGAPDFLDLIKYFTEENWAEYYKDNPFMARIVLKGN